MPDIVDVFTQLREFKWRDVSFPTTTFRVAIKHDLAQHKYPDVDGANIEATGREPLAFSARIPFINGIAPGHGETWADSRPLYPFVYRDFIRAFADRSKGILQHPELGFIQCRPDTADTIWDADVRNGVYVEVTWLETVDDALDTAAQLAAPSPIAEAISSGVDLDDAINTLPDVPQLPAYAPTFADTMRSLQAITDLPSLLSRQVAGKIDQVSYRVDQLSDAVAKNANPIDWPIFNACERAKSSLNDLKQTLLTTGKTLILFPVPKDMTLGAICASTGVDPVTLMTLNAALVQSPVVPAGSMVRYYEAA